MHDAGLARAVAHALHFRVASEQRAAQRAALAGGERRGRHARGLVHDYELRALEAQIERQLRLGRERFWLFQLDRDLGARAQQAGLFRAPTIDAHAPAFAQLRSLVPSDAGHVPGEESIEPAAFVGLQCFELDTPRAHHCPCSPRLMNERVPRAGFAGSMLK